MKKFMRGYYHLLNGEKEKGMDMMDSTIAVFTITECLDLVKRYRKYQDEALIQVRDMEKEERRLKIIL
jgi:hypothetical protein